MGPNAGAVADRLHSAAIHLLRGLRRTDPATRVSAAQLSALSVIVYGGPITQSALAAAEQVSRPTISLLVRRLEEAGLVEREADASDRRVARLRATARGREVLDHGRAMRLETLTQRLATLSDAELAELERAVGTLERIVRRL
jgi:DNA-binding MarR family transcriptional regulator